MVCRIDSVGSAEAGDDGVVGDEVGVAVVFEDVHDLNGFVYGFGSEEPVDEFGAQNDVGFVALVDEVAEEVEGLVEVAGFAGSGEGFEEMGVFEIEGMGLGLGNGRESAVDVGGFIENWECTGIRMGIGAVGVGVEQGEEIGGNCCCH